MGLTTGNLAGSVGKSFARALGVQVKSNSGMVMFDRGIIKRRWKQMHAGPLKRAGLMTRKFAVQSIRKRQKPKKGKSGKPSPPGTAPRSRASGHPMRRIFSVSDMFNTRETVGVLGFGGGGNAVPGLHEQGGFATRRLFIKKETFKHKGTKKTTGKYAAKITRTKAVRRVVRYDKRPFMMPALLKARSKFPELWRGSLTRAA